MNKWHEPTMSEPHWRWGVMAVTTDRSGRGPQELRRVLDAGWEPFAVADGYVYLKKREIKDANPAM